MASPFLFRLPLALGLVVGMTLLFPLTYGKASNIDNNASKATLETIAEHGGGCRKSSPPGMCCHMDHSTGIVHCH